MAFGNLTSAGGLICHDFLQVLAAFSKCQDEGISVAAAELLPPKQTGDTGVEPLR